MRIQARTFAVVVAVGALSLVAAPAQANEGDVTYYRDVLPIIQDNCQSCHQPEGQNLGGVVAPMSFMSYAGDPPVGPRHRPQGRGARDAAVVRLGAARASSRTSAC